MRRHLPTFHRWLSALPLRAAWLSLGRLRLPRVRLRLRTLLIAVAVAAFLFGSVARHRRFRAIADRYAAIVCYAETPSPEERRRRAEREAYRRTMYWKYRFAAVFPFLPVLPDPPRPE